METTNVFGFTSFTQYKFNDHNLYLKTVIDYELKDKYTNLSFRFCQCNGQF